MKYIIVAPHYNETSSGIRALYKLNTDLKLRGQESEMLSLKVYGDDKFFEGTYDDAIYVVPDCVSKSYFKAKNIVRYLLMYAGYFGQDKDFSKDELMYYYCQDFILNGRNPENILSMPIAKNHKRKMSGAPPERHGSCYLAIKYQDYFKHAPKDLPVGCVKITKEMDLGGLFSWVKKMYTFDNSAINIEAALMGIELEPVFNETFQKLFDFGPEWSWNDVIGSYVKQKENYYARQLPEFIMRTQEFFK